jgi:hypothetical protein
VNHADKVDLLTVGFKEKVKLEPSKESASGRRLNDPESQRKPKDEGDCPDQLLAQFSPEAALL